MDLVMLGLKHMVRDPILAEGPELKAIQMHCIPLSG